jgi:hypothetical protein
MTKQEREEFIMAVETAYDEYLQKTENRGMSWGEVAYIENLSVKEARKLLEECEEELGNE